MRSKKRPKRSKPLPTSLQSDLRTRLRYADFLIKTGAGAEAKSFLEEMNRKAPDYLPPRVFLMKMACAEHYRTRTASLACKTFSHRIPSTLMRCLSMACSA